MRAWVRDVLLVEREGWLALAGERAVGLLVLDGDWLDQLYVLPEAQGRGVGSRLVRHAQALSAGRLQLWVFQSNAPAVAFYRRHGFVIVESTDGRGNEEQAPDHRMLWSRPSGGQGHHF